MKKIIFAGAMILSLLACNRIEEEQPEQFQRKELTVTAFRADNDTKTARQSDGSVYWSPGDAISLFFRSGDNGGSKFTSQNSEEVAIAQFKGTIDVISGGGEDSGGEFWFWGVYPYSAQNSCDGSSITTVIPAQQTGKAGTFADNTFITMARAKGLELGFYNICSGLKFTLTRDDIKEVRIRGNNGEDIAGKIKAEWDSSGKPAIKQYVEGAKEVCVTAPGGGTFETGTAYYLVFAPKLFTQGFTLSLTTSDDKQGYFVYESERQFNRGIFINVSNLDTRVTSWVDVAAKSVTDEGGTVELDYVSAEPCEAVIPLDAQSWISVAPETKTTSSNSISLIVKPNLGLPRSATVNIVTKSDASNVVLAYTINQAVGGVWKEGGTIPPDNEIWYATSDNKKVELYDDNPFNNSIISHTYESGKGIIKCNSSITLIKDYTFFGNNNLTAVFLPNTIVEFKEGVFTRTGLKEVVLPASTKILGRAVYSECPNLRKVVLNEGLETLSLDCFWEDNLDCDIVLPSTLNNVDPYAFHNCSGIRGFYGNEKYHTADNRCFIYPFTSTSNPEWNGNWIGKFAGGVTDYVIPDGIIAIGNYSFEKDNTIVSVSIPSSVVEVRALAFYKCDNLNNLNGDCVSKDHRAIIFGNHFRRLVISKGLTKYIVPDGIKSIGESAFNELENLEEIIIPDSVVELGGYDFAFCNNLKKVVLSQNLSKVNWYNPFLHSSNLEKIYFRSFLPPEYSDTQFYESDCTHLTVYVPEETLGLYKSSGWYQYAPYMVGYKYDDIGEWNPGYYISTDFSADGHVTTLQTATEGAGIDLILMGDAFSDRQIADGTYGNVMQKAMNAFFSEEPYKTMKNRFNVYKVDVVSATEGYEHSGQSLSTGRGDGTYCYGNDDKVFEYALNAISSTRMDDALIIVMMNEDAYAGTCFMYYPDSGDYGRGPSIAYFPTSSDTDTFNGLVSHEAGGHGFAKLGDEYAYEYMGAVPSSEVSAVQSMATFGWYKNVDFTSDPTLVKWSHFITDGRYDNEHIDCYEGAFTYWTGAWRPTENSIMRYNTGGFNAPSREAIWYRIHKLAYGASWQYNYEDFVTYDAINRTPAAAAKRQEQIRRRAAKPLPPLHAPVVVKHSWREELQK